MTYLIAYNKQTGTKFELGRLSTIAEASEQLNKYYKAFRESTQLTIERRWNNKEQLIGMLCGTTDYYLTNDPKLQY